MEQLQNAEVQTLALVNEGDQSLLPAENEEGGAVFNPMVDVGDGAGNTL